MPRTRGILIAGNWKMNHGAKATREFAQAVSTAWSAKLSEKTKKYLETNRLQALVFPPHLSLTSALDAFTKTSVAVGCQNVHWEEKGAFTGELSGAMLAEIGVTWTLVGHSERRQYFGETDQTVKKRAESHLKQGFKIVLCIGETRTEREAGKTEAVIQTQLSQGLPDVWSDRLMVAYEPVWAIGTGLTATPEQAEEAHVISRREIAKKYGVDAAAKTLILYGGSVTPENAAGLLAQPNVDGGLVGGASLKSESFLALLEAGGNTLE